jgi:hypothetical protein
VEGREEGSDGKEATRRSSRFRDVMQCRLIGTDVSGKLISPIFKGLDCVALEDGTECPEVRNKLLDYFYI